MLFNTPALHKLPMTVNSPATAVVRHDQQSCAMRDILNLKRGVLTRQVLEQGGQASYTVLFNTTAMHGLPAAINEASNALLRTVTGNPGASIAVRNHPLPTLQQEAAVKFSKVAGQSLLASQPLSVLRPYATILLCRLRVNPMMRSHGD